MADLPSLFKLTATLVIIMDPVGNLPIFLALTRHLTKREQIGVATVAVVSAALILMLFGLAGEVVLRLFGLSLPAFQLAGGVIFFLYALQMLNIIPENIRSSVAEREESFRKAHVAVVPLGTPLLAGPGAITTVLVWQQTPGVALSLLELPLVVAMVSVAIWCVFAAGPWLSEKLGLVGIGVVTRIMGIILAVLAMEMVLQAVRVTFSTAGVNPSPESLPPKGGP